MPADRGRCSNRNPICHPWPSISKRVEPLTRRPSPKFPACHCPSTCRKLKRFVSQKECQAKSRCYFRKTRPSLCKSSLMSTKNFLMSRAPSCSRTAWPSYLTKCTTYLRAKLIRVGRQTRAAVASFPTKKPSWRPRSNRLAKHLLKLTPSNEVNIWAKAPATCPDSTAALTRRK